MRTYGYKKKTGVKKLQLMPRTGVEIECWFDGACWPNPGGHAAGGAIIKKNGIVVDRQSCYLGAGNTTNNMAEYGGLQLVLLWLMSNKVTQANIFGDSDLVINQMTGTWKCKDAPGKHYIPLYRRAKELRDELADVTFYWIPRDQNSEADEQSRVPLIQRGVILPK